MFYHSSIGQEVKHGVYICKLGERRLGISKQLVCNGRLNCPNGEDEQLCDTIDTGDYATYGGVFPLLNVFPKRRYDPG